MWIFVGLTISESETNRTIALHFENEYIDGQRMVDIVFKNQGDSIQDVIRKLLTLIGSLVSIGIGK